MAAVTQKKTEQTANDYMNELVTYVLNQPDGVEDTSRTVTVNGKNYQIQYNVPVKIPRFVANILEESRKQELKARGMIKQAAMKKEW